MRSINEAIKEIRQRIPQSAFTPAAVRRMIRSGEIPSVHMGSKYLINLDGSLSNYRFPCDCNVSAEPGDKRHVAYEAEGILLFAVTVVTGH